MTNNTFIKNLKEGLKRALAITAAVAVVAAVACVGIIAIILVVVFLNYLSKTSLPFWSQLMIIFALVVVSAFVISLVKETLTAITKSTKGHSECQEQREEY